MEQIRPGKYRHFKGGEYRVFCMARQFWSRRGNGSYRALYGERGIWVRPASMWNETVERDGKTFQRFTYIGSRRSIMQKTMLAAVYHGFGDLRWRSAPSPC